MDKDDLVNGYFSGSLSEIQLEELEQLLATDAKFAADFEFERELQSALKNEERQQIKAMFSQLGVNTLSEHQDGSDTTYGEKVRKIAPNENSEVRLPSENIERSISADKQVSDTPKSPLPQTKVRSIRPWLVAASIMLLMGLGVWFLVFDKPDLSNDQLYAANFSPYENVVHPIERGVQLEDLKTKAFTAYENQEYPLALALFKELQAQQADPYIAFYKAIVLMQLNEYGEAVPLLEDYMEKEGQLKDRAAWYLALAHLKLGEPEKSKTLLKKLTAQGGFKSEAAKELLYDMD